jgi:hypothetical protein
MAQRRPLNNWEVRRPSTGVKGSDTPTFHIEDVTRFYEIYDR